MSGPFQSEPDYRASLKSGHSPVKLNWFQRWFLKHYREAGENSRVITTDFSAYAGGRLGPVTPSVAYSGKEINLRNSIDLSLVRADGGWIVQFQTWDEHRDRHNVNHYVIPDSEDFGSRLAEIITLQCMR